VGSPGDRTIAGAFFFWGGLVDRLRTAAVACCFTCALSGATPALAQSSGLEVSWEYSRYGSGDAATSAWLGGSLALALHVSGPVSLVGFVDAARAHESSTAFSITEDTKTTFLAYGAGTRVGGLKEGIAPFLQVAGGAITQRASVRATGPFLDVDASGSETHPMAQAGLGLTAPINGRWKLVVEGDYRRIFDSDGIVVFTTSSSSSSGSSNGFRIAAGVRRDF